MKLKKYICRYLINGRNAAAWVEVDAVSQQEAAMHLLSRVEVEAVPLREAVTYTLPDDLGEAKGK